MWGRHGTRQQQIGNAFTDGLAMVPTLGAQGCCWAAHPLCLALLPGGLALLVYNLQESIGFSTHDPDIMRTSPHSPQLGPLTSHTEEALCAYGQGIRIHSELPGTARASISPSFPS